MWIHYYLYLFINFLYNILVYFVDSIKWVLRKIKHLFIYAYNLFNRLIKFIYRQFLKLIQNIFNFIKYIVRKIKSFFIWIYSNFTRFIHNLPIFLLTPILLGIVLVIGLVISFYYSCKNIVYSVLNRNDLLDSNKVITIRPIYNLPLNLIQGYRLILLTMARKKRKVLSSNSVDDLTLVKDLLNGASIVSLLVVGSIIVFASVVLTLPTTFIFSIISLSLVPKDESKFFNYIKKRIIIKKTGIETSFKLEPITFKSYNISWISKNTDIISNEGILNIAHKQMINNHVSNVEIIAKVEKNIVNNHILVIPLNYNRTKDILDTVYRNIVLPNEVNNKINFAGFTNNPEVKIEVKSMKPKVIDDNGIITNRYFTKRVKVHFLLNIILDDYYMSKRISTLVYNDNVQKYLDELINNTPDQYEISKGKIKLEKIIPYAKELKISFSTNERGVISRKGRIIQSNYDVSNSIEVMYSIKDLSAKKRITLIRRGDNKGLINELKQIVIPKFNRDCSIIELPKNTLLGDDGFEYPIEWHLNGNVINSIETNSVIKKSYTIDLMAKIHVNGIDGVRKIKLVIPTRSSKFVCKFELDNISPTIVSENRISLPKYGNDYKSRIFWITKTPEVISSKGYLRKPYMINRSSRKEAVVTAFVIYKAKTSRKDFVFELENNKFKYNQYIVQKLLETYNKQIKEPTEKEDIALNNDVDPADLTSKELNIKTSVDKNKSYNILSLEELLEIPFNDLDKLRTSELKILAKHYKVENYYDLNKKGLIAKLQLLNQKYIQVEALSSKKSKI